MTQLWMPLLLLPSSFSCISSLLAMYMYVPVKHLPCHASQAPAMRLQLWWDNWIRKSVLMAFLGRVSGGLVCVCVPLFVCLVKLLSGK